MKNVKYKKRMDVPIRLSRNIVQAKEYHAFCCRVIFLVQPPHPASIRGYVPALYRNK